MSTSSLTNLYNSENIVQKRPNREISNWMHYDAFELLLCSVNHWTECICIHFMDSSIFHPEYWLSRRNKSSVVFFGVYPIQWHNLDTSIAHEVEIEARFALYHYATDMAIVLWVYFECVLIATKNVCFDCTQGTKKGLMKWHHQLHRSLERELQYLDQRNCMEHILN